MSLVAATAFAAPVNQFAKSGVSPSDCLKEDRRDD
jgi:hypothetical protein